MTKEPGCYMVATVSADRNVIKKQAEKFLKYKDRAIEIPLMCNIKTKVTPVIIGATGTILKLFGQFPNNEPGKHEIKELHWALQTY
jgi:hypothetical protein